VEEKYKELLKGSGFALNGIDRVNFNPHPYTIGPKHVEHASDHHGGMLGDRTLDAIPCAVPGCNLSYAQHTSDNVMFLHLIKDLKMTEAQAELKKLTAEMEKDGIDGFAFVKSDFDFKE
jgi:hypothetical protein